MFTIIMYGDLRLIQNRDFYILSDFLFQASLTDLYVKVCQLKGLQREKVCLFTKYFIFM